MSKTFFQIALILISTRIGSSISQKFKLPAVLGALVAGILIGPSILGLVTDNEYIKLLSELGVIMLMFHAGLETNIDELRKSGVSSLLIAIGGIIVPLILGTTVSHLLINNFWTDLFIGVILTATSVSISVETLNELGKLNTKAGINILGAAVIDDILGLLIISFVLVLASSSKSVPASEMQLELIMVSIKVLVFLLVSFLSLIFLPKVFSRYLKSLENRPSIIVYSIAFALIFAYFSESLGIAAITGAYVCGLTLSRTTQREYIAKRVDVISSTFLAPIFFASVGISTNIAGMSSKLMVLTVIMLIAAIIGKIFGCGITAKLLGMSKAESMQIGCGMVSRGEVAIITTNLGLQNGLVSDTIFIPVLIVVVITTVITPVLLKISFSNKYQK